MQRIHETDRLASQSGVICSERLRETGVVILNSALVPNLTRALCITAAATGSPAILCDSPGGAMSSAGSPLFGPYTRLVDQLSSSTKLLLAEESYLQEDLLQFLEDFPQAYLILPVNDPGGAKRILDAIATLEQDICVCLVLATRSGVSVEWAADQRIALERIESIADSSVVCEGPFPTGWLAASHTIGWPLLSDFAWRQQQDYRSLLQYSLHSTCRHRLSGDSWEAYRAELAAGVRLHSLAGMSALLVGLGGLGTFFAWNLAFDCRQAEQGSHRAYVDNDTYSASNCNRQIFCSAADIGRGKAEVVCELSAEIDGSSEYRSHQVRVDTPEKLRPFVAEADVAIAAVDNDFARLQIADAAREGEKWFLTGGTNYRSGYVHIQLPGSDSFRRVTRVDRQPTERLQRNRSCGVAEASTIFPNAVCASLGYLELSAALAGQPHLNLRYFTDSPDNCIRPAATE